MTFALTPEQAAHQQRARAFAQNLRAEAGTVDRTGTIADPLRTEATELCGGDDLSMVVAVEELAAVSAAVAVSALGALAGAASLAGLRGATLPAESLRTQLGLAAVALGIARTAVAAALNELRSTPGQNAGDVEKPHWVVADAATELEAARILTLRAAADAGEADTAMARLLATAAATRAVDAALRLVGPAALAEGAELERLSRDIRALSLVLGGEEQQRATAANALYSDPNPTL